LAKLVFLRKKLKQIKFKIKEETMKKLNSIVLTVLVLAGLAATVNAQTSASASAQVKVVLVKPLSISLYGGDLDFGEFVLTGSNETLTKAAQNGAIFEVTGHPNRYVTVTFGNVTIDNSAWVAANGGDVGTMTFVPDVKQTGKNSSYANPIDVTSGSSHQLQVQTGLGKLFLWVGGSIGVASNQPQGEYVGTFTVSVEY